MQLRICASVLASCSPNTFSGLFWYCGACGGSVDRAGFLHDMLLPRRGAERAPRRHAAAFADARVRIEPGRDREFACALFVFVGLAHGLLLARRV